MFRRTCALFLACLVLWAAQGTLEAGHVPGEGPTHMSSQAAVGDAGPPSAPGSVEDHHLDDQPAQPIAESPADLPCLPFKNRSVDCGESADLQPASDTGDGSPLPCLDGPRRPPRLVA